MGGFGQLTLNNNFAISWKYEILENIILPIAICACGMM